ncbi:hypothetical protein DMUE_2232 [Dictyocoela muelleri]|nr:hypothetical protein DMUE_2232 [Dictyocoela muelleri]
MLKANNIIHTTTRAYNPTRNSISERINKTLGDISRMYKGKSVFEHKTFNETRLNHTYHRVLKASPYEILFKYAVIDLFKKNMKRASKKAMKRVCKFKTIRR